MSWLESFKTVSKKKQIRRGYVHLPGNTTSCSRGLFAGLPLGHPLGSNLDPWLAESLDRVEGVDLECLASLSRESLGTDLLTLGLVVTTLRLVLDTTARHNAGCQHVTYNL